MRTLPQQWSSFSTITHAEMKSVRDEVHQLYQFLQSKRNVVAITGAGVSTASGIPDYRGVNGSYRKGHKPMVHSEFMNHNSSRQRYWSRSMKGFRFLGDAKPNDAHIAIRQLQQRGAIKHVITQNVDGLHTKAGTENLINIHGRIDEVKCMSCHSVSCRHAFQSELETHNPTFLSNTHTHPLTTPSPLLTNTRSSDVLDKLRADGDLELDASIDISQVSRTAEFMMLDKQIDNYVSVLLC